MSIDPATGFALDTETKTANRLADLERAVARLERGVPTIQAAAGAPTTTPRSGTAYVDETAVRLYLRVGGTWRYTVLT